MTYYVESLKVLCLQTEIEIAMHGNSMFFIAKMYEIFYVRPATWVATVPAKDCYHPSTGEDYCNFFFSFCKLLPHARARAVFQLFILSGMQAQAQSALECLTKIRRLLKVRTISMQLL